MMKATETRQLLHSDPDLSFYSVGGVMESQVTHFYIPQLTHWSSQVTVGHSNITAVQNTRIKHESQPTQTYWMFFALGKSTRLLPQCCVQACLRWVHLFMNSWGPSAVVLRRCDTPLHPSTLAVKHLAKSNALHSLTSNLHHILSDVKQGDKRLTYLISSPHKAPSTSARARDESQRVAVCAFEHSWLSEVAARDHRPYLCRKV